MKSFILDPTYENILECFKNDSIGRNIDVIEFTRLITAIGGGKSIAIDSEWGNGKTFFIKQTKMLLDAFNDYGIEGVTHGLVSIDEANTVKEILHKAYPNYNFEPYVTVYYDAWLNDSDEDPILSILYNIMTSNLVDISDRKLIERIKTLGRILGNVVEIINGLPISSIAQNIKKFIDADDELIQSISPRKRIHEEIQSFLDDIIVGEEKGIVLFIDELDRCRPIYAVQLLERIKHYFKDDKLIFVFSVNKEELQYTIKSVYGQGFNAIHYLNRFFDYNLTLPECDRDKFFKTIDLGDDSHYYDMSMKDLSDYFGFSLRDTIRLQDLCSVAFAEIKKYNYGTANWNLDHFIRCCYLFVPMLISLKLHSENDYNSLVKGKNLQLFKEIVNYKNIRTIYERYFSGSATPMEVGQFNEMLEQLYRIMFVKGFKEGYFEVSVGKLIISSGDCKEVLRIASLISRFCISEDKE